LPLSVCVVCKIVEIQPFYLEGVARFNWGSNNIPYIFRTVDEYSRWCYREIHAEHSAYISGLFLRSAVKAPPFAIHMVQTDKGHEFTNALFGQKKERLTRFYQTLDELGIVYRRICVGTSKQNGRV
jgi:hypothetical protein